MHHHHHNIHLFKPLGNKVLVSLLPESTGSVTAPEGYRSGAKPRAAVLAVGPLVADIRVQDTVILPTTGGTAVKIGDAPLVVIAETEVLAVLPSTLNPSPAYASRAV